MIPSSHWLRSTSLCLAAMVVIAAEPPDESNPKYPLYPFLTGVTITVEPGRVPASGLNAIPGIASVIIQGQPGWYIDRLTHGPVGNPAALYRELEPSDPCPENLNIKRIHPFEVAAQAPDLDVSHVFNGYLTRCAGQGGPPPKFEARIVNIDVDFDSDNDSDPFAGQKALSLSPAEDQVEWPVDEADYHLPGLLLIVNHGFEESDLESDRAEIRALGQLPKQDFEKDLATSSDGDLSIGWMRISGGKSGKAVPTYTESGMRLYRRVASATPANPI